jgi:hypothetical protein
MCSTATKSGRLRTAGTIVAVIGIVAATIFYIYRVRQQPADDLNALIPRYERDMRHEIGVQQGAMGIILMEWQERLTQPGAEALMIAGVAAIFGAGFFRAAWVVDDDERERREAQDPPRRDPD